MRPYRHARASWPASMVPSFAWLAAMAMVYDVQLNFFVGQGRDFEKER